MSDKLSMSLDDIVKGARSAKDSKKEQASGGKGGKAKKEKGGKGRDAPYEKKEKKEPQEKKEKAPREKKERPPADPSTLLFIGNLAFTLESAVLQEHLATVAPCTVELKMRERGGVSKPAGYALATFESIEAATEVIEKLHDSEVGGRKMIARFASAE